MIRVVPLLFALTACGGTAPAPSDEPAEEAEEATKADAAATPEADAAPAAEGDAEMPDYAKPPADVMAPPGDATTTATGLAYKVLTPGAADAAKPSGPTSTVQVHYTGWTTDGKMFDSSYKRKEPASFPLNGVIAGWTEGVQLMKVGDKTRFWIPQELAYRGMPGRPAGMLVFDIELLDVVDPPSAPADVAAPPKDAKKTASGLAYKQLEPGTGPKPASGTATVQVHYTGWTTDGNMFDSSLTRGRPATFPLDRVIAGWTEGLQLMEKGSTYRLWIPEELAYKGQPGRPAGMLVFDVELLDIVKE